MLPAKFGSIWPSSFRGEDFSFHILIYSSETNGTKLGRKHLYKVLYKFSSFRPIPPTNMAPRVILVSDWLMLKKSSSKSSVEYPQQYSSSLVTVNISILIAHLDHMVCGQTLNFYKSKVSFHSAKHNCFLCFAE
jgi:hypothetical protein